MNKFFHLLFLFFVACNGCTDPIQPKGPVSPPVEAGPLPTPPANSDCAAACAVWNKYGCDEGKPTLKGASCEDVCSNAATDDSPLTLSPDCVKSPAVTSCETARACQQAGLVGKKGK
jgi:hypothetical protein